MVYSNAAYPDDPATFPTPPMWLTWEGGWRAADGRNITGSIRHQESLEKARAYVSGNARSMEDGRASTWMRSWRIYEWVEGRYVLRYQGNHDEPKAACPLFARRMRPPKVVEREYDENLAIASILSATG